MERFSRRDFLLASLAAGPLVRAASAHRISAPEDEFLEDLQRRSFRYFWDHADANTGLVLDRTRTDGTRTNDVASSAATGFGLTSLCIAAARRWVDPAQARDRVRTTLIHLASRQPHVRGWFYHFVDQRTGGRVWNCEVSTIDTALLLAGMLTAQQYFSKDSGIVALARQIYERVDFQWAYDRRSSVMQMGWTPESGFLSTTWSEYRENAILNILAIGSTASGVPVRAWYGFDRDRVAVGPYRYVGAGPLFTHQYSHAWVDFRGQTDGAPFQVDYFQNSVAATFGNRAYCLELRKRFPSYSETMWGITASDTKSGYVGWGGVLGPGRDVDGTVVPCAPGGSLMFAPDICLPTLRNMQEQFGEKIYGRYGFADAFHPATGWIDSDVIGIDLGITLLSAENLRSGRVWNWFMRTPSVRDAMGRIFRPEAG